MKKKRLFNTFGGIFLLTSIILFLGKANFTGAVIGLDTLKNFSLVFPLAFLLVSMLMFTLARNIRTHYYLQGARDATGSAVIVDTYRGSSLISTLLGEGAEQIYPVGTPEEARKKAGELKERGYKVVLMGEKDQKTPKDFDFGNSLEDVVKNAKRIKGATIVYVSTNAVAGILEAKKEGRTREVLIGSPVNRKSLVDYLSGVEDVSIVAMGESGRYAEEDMDYAEYLKDLMEGKNPNYEETRQKILRGTTAQLAGKYNAEFDRDYALELDKWDVVPKLEGDRIVDAKKERKSKK